MHFTINLRHLEMSVDGVGWVDTPDEFFPDGGLRVVWPYTVSASRYNFKVAHMFGHSSAELGINAGDIEIPTFYETANGLVFYLSSTSPIAIGYRDGTVPATGDDSNIAFWLGAMLVALGGLGVTATVLRKKKKES